MKKATCKTHTFLLIAIAVIAIDSYIDIDSY